MKKATHTNLPTLPGRATGLADLPRIEIGRDGAASPNIAIMSPSVLSPTATTPSVLTNATDNDAKKNVQIDQVCSQVCGCMKTWWRGCTSALQVEDATMILPGLWLGSHSASACEPWLEAHGITARLRLREFAWMSPNQHQVATAPVVGVQDLCLQLEDDPHDDLMPQLPAAWNFLDAIYGARHLPKNRASSSWLCGRQHILVHCAAGISRSASVLASWLMRRYGWSDSNALTFLRYQRPEICPNLGFRIQLHALSFMLRAVAKWKRFLAKKKSGVNRLSCRKNRATRE